VLLRATGVSKLYSGKPALANVTFEIGAGEVVGVIGENGAGKSTLVSILGGALRPDAGEITWKDKKVAFRSPREAAAAGIGVVHQHDSHVSRFTVAENLALAEGAGAFPKRAEWEARVREVAARYRLDPGDPAAPVETLSVGARQRLEILKALARPKELLLLDEPTAALTPAETAELLRVMQALREGGVSLVLVTHKLEEILAACSRIVVLRRGEVVREIEAARASASDLASAMVGHAVETARRQAMPGGGASAERNNSGAVAIPHKPPALEIRDLATRAAPGRSAVGPLSLSVARGEIGGIAGVDGNGQLELLEAILGLTALAAGSVNAESIGSIAPDRRRQGLLLDLSVEENLLLDSALLSARARNGVLDPAATRAAATEAIARHNIAAPGPGAPARRLSGGNQQKIVIARAFARNPAALVAAQPTRGLDVDATAAVRREILGFAERGGGVLLISTDLDEIDELCHRVFVMFRGRLAGPFDAPLGEAARAEVGAAMAGGSRP
jgi:simple sugar transport system ATP-binding protein